MITLTNEETLKLHVTRNRLNSLDRRYKTRTLHKWWCLNCKAETYVKYGITSIANIFCDDEEKNCKEHLKNPNIVHYQYFKRLKDEQLKMFETIDNTKISK